jgi:hypothetical protein
MRPLWLLAAFAIILLYIHAHHHGPYLKPKHQPSLRYKNVDWRMYAYATYATDLAYLCNAVMLFESLNRLGSKAQRVLFYPREWDTHLANSTDRKSQLLVKARDWYSVQLEPVAILGMEREDEARGKGSLDQTATRAFRG